MASYALTQYEFDTVKTLPLFKACSHKTPDAQRLDFFTRRLYTEIFCITKTDATTRWLMREIPRHPRMSALTPVPTYTCQQLVNPDVMHTGPKSDNPLFHNPTCSVNKNSHTYSGFTKQNMSNAHNFCTHHHHQIILNSDNDNDYDNL